MKVAWLTDTASGCIIDAHEDIFVVPMGVILNDQHYQDQAELSIEDFYKLLQQYGDGAKTTQPNFQALHDMYDHIESLGYTHVIAIHPSSELTGSFQNSVKASQESSLTCAVIDSRIGSYPMKAMINKGMALFEEGLSFDAVVEQLKVYTEDAMLFVQPKNLNQMKKSGRVSKTQSIMAGLLNIQLILKFEDGKVYPIEKVRTKKKVIEAMKTCVAQALENSSPEEICVVYAGDRSEADLYIDWLKSTYPQSKIVDEILVPVAGVHLGYGTVGISWINA
ncbi:DegV family protein [Macrococcus armenti]|uniref:DegV family protein n=1 Tax=Macrococcus armenti TaxID=2875764 RepID=UPI001CC8F4E8|nr:DegV family protein [Macrococcus armenti]UBH13631.1 DegV family protein [Macrococcus armenti]UBH22859.1 DegV family protein [Macrococcus armenti]